jgi:hypothetical protein
MVIGLGQMPVPWRFRLGYPAVGDELEEAEGLSHPRAALGAKQSGTGDAGGRREESEQGPTGRIPTL